jgi:hypothetical protein
MCAAAMALLPLGGCEMFEETYTLSSETVFNQGGVQVEEYVREDFGGSRWLQYHTSNNNSYNICARVSLASGGHTNGHSMGSVLLVPGYGSLDVGYV